MIKPAFSVSKTIHNYSEEPAHSLYNKLEQAMTEAIEKHDWRTDYIVDIQIDFIEVP